MEWKIILPVLCLIGFLHVPGNAADTHNNSTNSSIAFEFDIVFYINATFNETYSNMTNADTITLKTSIISQVTPLYAVLKNFQLFDILKFRNGSIVVEGKLYFNSNDSKPSAANLTQILNSGNFNFTILSNLTRITEVTTTAAPAVTTNQATAAASTIVQTPAKLAKINLVFKILQPFKEIYSNFSDPETKQLSDNITNAFTPSYRKRFSNFFRMWIKKFSAGSIVADTVFEFDTTNSTGPNVTDVTKAFTDAIATGNFSFTVDTTSINATDITNSDTNVTANTSITTQAATTIQVATTASVAAFNLTFKMAGIFTNDLSNLSSTVATNLSNTIISQLDGVFKVFTGYRRTFIRRYSNGSIVVDAGIECNPASSPTAAQLAKTLADGVRNGIVSLPIDPKTIAVTDSTGNTANNSPVLASMLTAFWMTLASLLLSAVMH